MRNNFSQVRLRKSPISKDNQKSFLKACVKIFVGIYFLEQVADCNRPLDV